MDYYIVSVNHTKRWDRYITVWRPDDSGYAYPLSWAGKYPRDQVMASLGYYNNGMDTVAVPCHVLDEVAAAPIPGRIDDDAGPVVENNRANWKRILANTIAPPKHQAHPEFKGARRTTQAA